MRDNCRLHSIPAFIIILLFIGSLLAPAGLSGRGYLELAFLDVGQGDSILIKSPQGRFVLVDGGGSPFFQVGRKTVLPYLHHRGIRQLQMIINTHPDIDHLQGLEGVAREMNCAYFGLPASLQNRREYESWRNTAAATGGCLVPLGEGQKICLEEGLDIEVVHPGTGAFAGDDINGQSVVLIIRYRHFSALLCGDITSAEMLRMLDKIGGPATLVKVPHHGSKGSWCNDFYERLQPQLAVISVGKANPFGHPANLVVDGLEREGIDIMRTDREGAIIVKSDGRRWTVAPTRRNHT